MRLRQAHRCGCNHSNTPLQTHKCETEQQKKKKERKRRRRKGKGQGKERKANGNENRREGGKKRKKKKHTCGRPQLVQNTSTPCARKSTTRSTEVHNSFCGSPQPFLRNSTERSCGCGCGRALRTAPPHPRRRSSQLNCIQHQGERLAQAYKVQHRHSESSTLTQCHCVLVVCLKCFSCRLPAAMVGHCRQLAALLCSPLLLVLHRRLSRKPPAPE